MDDIKEFKRQLRFNIIKKYKSLTNFCKVTGISQPYLSRSLSNNCTYNTSTRDIFVTYEVWPKPSIPLLQVDINGGITDEEIQTFIKVYNTLRGIK